MDNFGLIPFQGFFKLVSFGRFQKLFIDQPLIQFNREVSVRDTDVQKSNQLLNSLDSHYLEQAGLLTDFLQECTHDHRPGLSGPHSMRWLFKILKFHCMLKVLLFVIRYDQTTFFHNLYNLSPLWQFYKGRVLKRDSS